MTSTAFHSSSLYLHTFALLIILFLRPCIPNPLAYRALQDKVSTLEAEKNSHINKISDLRALLKKVNTEGEKRVTFMKNKNVSLPYFPWPNSIHRLCSNRKWLPWLNSSTLRENPRTTCKAWRATGRTPPPIVVPALIVPRSSRRRHTRWKRDSLCRPYARRPPQWTPPLSRQPYLHLLSLSALPTANPTTTKNSYTSNNSSSRKRKKSRREERHL